MLKLELNLQYHLLVAPEDGRVQCHTHEIQFEIIKSLVPLKKSFTALRGSIILVHEFRVLTKLEKYHFKSIIVCSDTVEERNEKIYWLRNHREPQARLLEYWRATAKARLCFIHGSTNPSVAEILTKWPRYGDETGYSLVSFFICTVLLQY